MAHVVIHAAVSLDGATEGFEPDIARFYALAATFEEDVTLAGADTILAQAQALEAAKDDAPGPSPTGPLLAVTDRRHRVPDQIYEALRNTGHWRDAVPIRQDLQAALGDAVVRVDSGGALNGALLRAGLVNEISLLVHPQIAGDAKRWWGDPPPPPLQLEPLATEAPDWLRYRVV